jgi:hypothetical protein
MSYEVAMKASIKDLGSGKAQMTITGKIDEESTFPDIADHISHLEIDFEDLSFINSCGIREWFNWGKTFSTIKHITFLKCPNILVDQFNLIHGMLEGTNEISSVYIPYYCDPCDALHSELVQLDENFDFKTIANERKCKKCGKAAELDIIPDKYFNFLNHLGRK